MKFFENIKNGKLIRAGILMVLAVSPLPFGSVQTGVFFTIEIFILFLFLLWILRVWLNKTGEGLGGEEDRRAEDGRSGEDRRAEVRKSGRADERQEAEGVEESTRAGEGNERDGRHHHRRRSRLTVRPLFVVLGLIVLLLAFQMAPLPPAILNLLSTNSYQMHDKELSDVKSIPGMEELYGGMAQNESGSLGSREARRLEGAEDNRLKIGKVEGRADNRWRSISFNPYLTKAMLYKILAYCLIFFLVIRSVEGFDQARRMIYVVIFMGVFQAVYGLIDFFTGHNYIFYYQKVYGGGVVTGTFINRNHLAGYLEMVIPLALSFCLDKIEKESLNRRPNWRDRFLSLEYLNSQYVFLLFLVAVMAFALLFSMSRMGMICLFISLTLMGLAFSLRRESVFHRKIFLAVVAVLVVLGILAGVGEIIARFQGLSGDLEGEGARLDVWKDSFNMVREFPWFGIGAGNYSFLFHKYRSLMSDLFFDHAHNDYLEMLVESGLIGLGLFLFGVTYFAVAGVRFLRREQDSSRWTVVMGGLAGLLAKRQQ